MPSNKMRNSIIVSVVVLIITCQSVCGQVGAYATEIKTVSSENNTEIDYNVVLLLGKKTYAVIYSFCMYDIIVDYCLSSGTYKACKKDFVLTDKLRGWQMSAIMLNDSVLSFKSGLSGLKGLCFTSLYECDKNCEQQLINVCRIQNESCLRRKELNEYKRHAASYEMAIGEYRQWPKSNYSVVFDKDGRFYCLFTDTKFIVSQGIWRRDGDLLVLYDDFLNKPFYMLIEKDCLLSRFIPGETKDCDFFPVP